MRQYERHISPLVPSRGMATPTPTIRSGRSSRLALGVVALSLLTALTACGDKKDEALTTDTTLGRDLAMAATDTNAQPKLQDVPTTPPPADVAPANKPKPKPTPKPAAPAPKPAAPPAAAPVVPTPVATTGTVSAGTSMSFAVSSKICSNTTPAGEKFTAALSQPVTGSNGATIPAGAIGTFEVTQARTAKNSGDSTFLRVRMVSVTFGGNTYPVEATLQTASTDRVRSASKGTDAKKVAGGAVIGAIAGQIIGKNTKGTVIGAAAGAAAGTAAAAATADYDTCLNSGAAIAVKLDGPVTVKIAS
jgi:outer membrane biosynthesis protein TonB